LDQTILVVAARLPCARLGNHLVFDVILLLSQLARRQRDVSRRRLGPAAANLINLPNKNAANPKPGYAAFRDRPCD
jgi:hypothetical protein